MHFLPFSQKTTRHFEKVKLFEADFKKKYVISAFKQEKYVDAIAESPYA